jgi:hypothetical protein
LRVQIPSPTQIQSQPIGWLFSILSALNSQMKYKQLFVVFLTAILILLLNACSTSTPSPSFIGTTEPTKTNSPIEQSQDFHTPIISPTIASIISQPPIYLGFSFQQSDGNRFVSGQGCLPSETPIDITLPNKPIWVLGAPYQNGAIFVAVLKDGNTVSYYASEQGVVESEIPPSTLAPGMPTQLGSSGDAYWLNTVPSAHQSSLTHPAFLPQSDIRAYITLSGDLEFVDSSDQVIATLQVNAQPDARILTDEQDRLLLLTEPTERYNHGVLGDTLEASSITLIDTEPSPHIESKISLPDNEVIEGIAPIWVDITGDGQREIIVTVSDINLGAGIVIFTEDGERFAEGPKIGQPFLWRHQIAFGSFGPNSENELAVVRTPHIGGVVEFYQYSDGKLNLMAEYSGVTSHIIGSRNLDMSAAGDFDGDGLNELLVLNSGLSEIIALRRTSAGAQQVWQVPIDGRLSTNLAGVNLPNGRILFSLGREDGVLRIWSP